MAKSINPKIQIPPRLIWAVDVLKLKQSDKVAEIGCGHGLATLIASQKIKSGRILSIDRSATAIAKARKLLSSFKNVTLEKVPLKTDALGKTKYDKIFCFNVNVFWIDPHGKNGEFSEIHRVLKKDGKLYLFYQLPGGRIDEDLLEKLKKIFSQHEFRPLQTVVNKEKGISSFGLILSKV